MNGQVIHENPEAGRIRIGLNEVGIVDSKYKRAIWQNSGSIIFKGRAEVGVGMRISNKGELTIGDNCRFNANSDIICRKKISFGDDCLISWECLIMDGDFHKIYSHEETKPINQDQGITIGNHVWIGSRCTVLKGAAIPDYSVLASCSLVTKALALENCIYASNKIIKENIRWED